MPDPGPDEATRRRAIVRDGLGVGMATGLYGVSFGAVSVAAGLSVLQTCVLSLVMFTGASQFAIVGVAAAGGAPLSGAATALMLGTRNTLYGLKLAPLLQFRGLASPPGRAAGHRRVDRHVGHPRLDHRRPDRLPQHGPRRLRAVEPLHLRRRHRRQPDRRPAHLRARRRGRRRVPGPALATPGRPAQPLVAACAAAVALGVVPVTAAGVPVLVAGGVALLAGLLTRNAEDPTEIPAP